MLVHTGIKKLQCKVCEKKFSQKGDLNRHMLTHTKVKAHECDICKKNFTRRDSLLRHFRIHLGEKPHVSFDIHKTNNFCYWILTEPNKVYLHEII